MFMVITLLNDPSADPVQRRAEWGHTAVVAGVWALLIGTGLGSTGLILLGGLVLNATIGWWWADPIAGLAMVPIIAREGIDGFRGQSACADCC